MNCQHVNSLLNDFVDGRLTKAERADVEEHLGLCSSCRSEAESLSLLLQNVQSLPKNLFPASDLWPEIAEQLPDQAPSAKPQANVAATPPGHREDAASHWRLSVWQGALAAAIALLATLSVFFMTFSRQPSWEVVSLAGQPKVGAGGVIEEAGRLPVGAWLETDAFSRARIFVADIGRMEVAPNSRIRLVESADQHRVALARGAIEASIWAPPRLFFVETPSAVAVDLGCVYRLKVDETGAGLLHVLAGWVALEQGSRESFVPAGAVCATRPGIGPGTPYFEDAPELFKQALSELDFAAASEVLETVLGSARVRDSLTLWHLLSRVATSRRALVYEKLASLAAPPPGVTREGILQLDPVMLEAWKNSLEILWYQYPQVESERN